MHLFWQKVDQLFPLIQAQDFWDKVNKELILSGCCEQDNVLYHRHQWPNSSGGGWLMKSINQKAIVPGQIY